MPGQPVHRRTWILGERYVRVEDRIDGAGTRAVSRVHFHPLVGLDMQGLQGVAGVGDSSLAISVSGASVCQVSVEYSREFGLLEAASCLELSLEGDSAAIDFDWR